MKFAFLAGILLTQVIFYLKPSYDMLQDSIEAIGSAQKILRSSLLSNLKILSQRFVIEVFHVRNIL